jgi:hypothetical protein
MEEIDMGWWSEESDGDELIVGDEPLDAAGEAFDKIAASYLEEVGRKPTVSELARTLEQALMARFNDMLEGAKDKQLAGIRIKVKKKPKTQRISDGDHFSVPLPSGGYGCGRVKRFYPPSTLLVEFLNSYSDSPPDLASVVDKPVVLEVLCGYLKLADWEWRVIGNLQEAVSPTGPPEQSEVDALLRLGIGMSPGTAEIRLVAELRKRGRIR